MKKLYIPPALILYCFIIIVTLYLFAPEFNIIVFPFNLLGLIIAFSGFYLMGKTKDLFKKHQTTLAIEKSSSIITESIFSKTRNPMYLGMFIMVFGIAVFSSNLISLILPFIFIFLIRIIFIPKEEKLLSEEFGEQYQQYKKKIKRWF